MALQLNVNKPRTGRIEVYPDYNPNGPDLIIQSITVSSNRATLAGPCPYLHIKYSNGTQQGIAINLNYEYEIIDTPTPTPTLTPAIIVGWEG